MPGIPIGAIDNLKARLKKIFKKKEKAPKEDKPAEAPADGTPVADRETEPTATDDAAPDVVPAVAQISDSSPVISADPPEIAPLETSPTGPESTEAPATAPAAEAPAAETPAAPTAAAAAAPAPTPAS